MKMVSQLTRQAMRRHQQLSAGTVLAPPAASSPPPQPISPQPTGFSLVQPLYAPAVPGDIAPALPETPPPRPQPAQPRPRTIYQQLMTSHDRITERHLTHT